MNEGIVFLAEWLHSHTQVLLRRLQSVLIVSFGVNQAPSPRSKPRHEAGSSRSSQASSSPPQYKLHSFSLLNYDRERLERKVFFCHMVPHPRTTSNGSPPADPRPLSSARSLSFRLPNTKRRGMTLRRTCCSSTKRLFTGCSGRRHSWSEILLLSSQVARIHTVYDANDYY